MKELSLGLFKDYIRGNPRALLNYIKAGAREESGGIVNRKKTEQSLLRFPKRAARVGISSKALGMFHQF